MAAWRRASRAEHLELGLGQLAARRGLGGLERRGHRRHRPGLEVAEEALQGAPDVRPARDALPVRLHDSHQHVAAVDRRDRVGGRVREAVHDQRLGVRLELVEHRVQLAQPAPGLEVELALGGAGGARVERHHAVGHAAVEEEGEPDRDPERGPDVVRQLEVRQPDGAAADRSQLGVARAQRPAALAHADDLALDEVQQVAVVLRHPHLAEVAALARVGDRGLRGRGALRARPGQRPQAAHHLGAAARGPRVLDRAAAVHDASATRTLPFSRSNGTGASCSRSSSSERPARGRK